jgi:ADP-ribose pyrophosphatase YjhB (NUDIX family)
LYDNKNDWQTKGAKMTPPSITLVSTIVKRGDTVLMIQEGKNNRGQRGKWNFPAGHAELGESLVEAAIREVKEETGYDVKIDGLIAIKKKDFADEMGIVFFFAGTLLNERPEPPEDQTLQVQFVPIEQIANLDLRFDDLKTVLRNSDKVYPLEILMIKEEI